MTDLSPAAQAVANAIEPLDWESGHCTYKDICFISRQVAATAVRVAADQVVPLPRLPYDSCCDVSASAIRAEMLAIAAELEGTNA
jgi:hypothetical protein